MSDPVLVLDFEITQEQILALMKRDRRRFKTQWLRLLVALFFAILFLWQSVTYWRSGELWTFGIMLLCGAFMATPHTVMVAWVMRFLLRNQPPVHARVEIDDIGLRMHSAEHKTHNRWWWSRLTGVDEIDGDYELMFDGESYPGMYIPAHAFADDNQRQTFRRLIEQHLPDSTSGNSGASPSDSPAFRFGV